jgi:hypothetical protein
VSARVEPDPHELADERRRLDRLRRVVDTTCALLMQARLTRPEAERLVALACDQILLLFPDKRATYELVLAPRFARLMAEFAGSARPSSRPARGSH